MKAIGVKRLYAVFCRFGRNLLGSVKDHLPLHAMAIVLTFVIAISGLDWYWNLLNAHHLYGPIDHAVLLLGTIVPFLGPLITFAYGKLGKKRKVATAGLLLWQSMFIAMIVQSFYKAFTGRVPPWSSELNGEDLSLLFRFGFLRGGIHAGWPSGHTMIAFAMTVSLMKFLPEKKWPWMCALPYAAFMGIGMNVSTIHWLSDTVAGMLIGIAIGLTVGKSYNEEFGRKVSNQRME